MLKTASRKIAARRLGIFGIFVACCYHCCRRISIVTMAKLSLPIIASIVAGASAFAPAARPSARTSLKASDKGYWDPLGLYTLGEGTAFDTFPNMFPAKQYLDDSEIKHGRMSMLAWTGIWATHQVSMGISLKRFQFSRCTIRLD